MKKLIPLLILTMANASALEFDLPIFNLGEKGLLVYSKEEEDDDCEKIGLKKDNICFLYFSNIKNIDYKAQINIDKEKLTILNKYQKINRDNIKINRDNIKITSIESLKNFKKITSIKLDNSVNNTQDIRFYAEIEITGESEKQYVSFTNTNNNKYNCQIVWDLFNANNNNTISLTQEIKEKAKKIKLTISYDSQPTNNQEESSLTFKPIISGNNPNLLCGFLNNDILKPKTCFDPTQISQHDSLEKLLIKYNSTVQKVSDETYKILQKYKHNKFENGCLIRSNNSLILGKSDIKPVNKEHPFFNNQSSECVSGENTVFTTSQHPKGFIKTNEDPINWTKVEKYIYPKSLELNLGSIDCNSNDLDVKQKLLCTLPENYDLENTVYTTKESLTIDFIDKAIAWYRDLDTTTKNNSYTKIYLDKLNYTESGGINRTILVGKLFDKDKIRTYESVTFIYDKNKRKALYSSLAEKLKQLDYKTHNLHGFPNNFLNAMVGDISKIILGNNSKWQFSFNKKCNELELNDNDNDKAVFGDYKKLYLCPHINVNKANTINTREKENENK